REDAAAIADDREPPLADHAGDASVAGIRGAGPVEVAVPQHDAAGPNHCPLELHQRVDLGTERADGAAMKRIVLALDGVAPGLVHEGDALRDQLGTGGRVDEVSRALRPEP